MRTFEEQIVLSFYDVDLNQNGRLPSLIAVAMLVAENHLKQLQLSEEWLLEYYQLVWVVTGHQLQVYRLPVYREQVCIKTEVIAYNRYFCLRGFTFYGKTGEVLLELETSFVLINPVSRQLVGMPKELLQGFQEISEKKSHRMPKLAPIELGDEQICPIRYFDVDSNGHVNNSRYLEWVYESLPLAFVSQHLPKTLVITYTKEIAPTQTVIARTNIEGLTTRHAFLADCQSCVQVQIDWENIEK